MKTPNKKISSKVFYGIIAGFAGLSTAFGYFYVRHAVNNYAVIMFGDNQEINSEDIIIDDSCDVWMHAYGSDEDGLSKLEIIVDENNYLTRNLDGIKDYGLTLNFCLPQVSTGKHTIHLIVTDSDGDTEHDERVINVFRRAYRL